MNNLAITNFSSGERPSYVRPFGGNYSLFLAY